MLHCSIPIWPIGKFIPSPWRRPPPFWQSASFEGSSPARRTKNLQPKSAKKGGNWNVPQNEQKQKCGTSLSGIVIITNPLPSPPWNSENWWLEDYFPFGKGFFRGYVSFTEDNEPTSFIILLSLGRVHKKFSSFLWIPNLRFGHGRKSFVLQAPSL